MGQELKVRMRTAKNGYIVTLSQRVPTASLEVEEVHLQLETAIESVTEYIEWWFEQEAKDNRQ